jgi:hypothetical protein
MKVTSRLGRPSPDPWFGTPVELRGGLGDLVGIGKTRPSKGIASKEPPPALLQIEPARSHRDEDMLDAWMISKPGIGLGTGVAGQMIGDHVQLPLRIRLFNLLKQGDVTAFRCVKLHNG